MLTGFRSKRSLTENDHARRLTQKPTEQGVFFSQTSNTHDNS
jgi:hypothetical protein